MTRVVFTSHVAPQHLQAYRKAHADVWPAMLEALRDTGWKGYTLHLSPTGLLVGVVDLDDSYQDAQQRMSRTAVNARWQKAMAALFASDGAPDEDMEVLETVMDIDHQLARHGLRTTQD